MGIKRPLIKKYAKAPKKLISGILGYRMSVKIAVQIFGGLPREGYFQLAINNHIEKARKKVKFKKK